MTAEAPVRRRLVAPRLPSTVAGWILRPLVAVALVIDAVIHLQLASLYDLAAPAGIGQGNLFRIESAVALLVFGLVLLYGNRASFLAALLVLASGLAAVLLYRYVKVPAFGPIPSMYEPIWFFKKTLSAIAEGAGTLIAATALARTRRIARR